MLGTLTETRKIYELTGRYPAIRFGDLMPFTQDMIIGENELEYAEKRLEHYRDIVASGKLKKYLETGKSDKADTFRVEAGSPLENYLKSKVNKTQG